MRENDSTDEGYSPLGVIIVALLSWERYRQRKLIACVGRSFEEVESGLAYIQGVACEEKIT